MDSLLVADSFRVRENPRTGTAEVRGLERHLDRFRRSALEAWCGPHVPTARERERHALESIDAFIAESLPRIRAFGAGWPRLELRGEVGEAPVGSRRREGRAAPRLELQLRPLPALGDTIELRTAGPVETAHPERKGPNIARYAELNRELGAEAILTDALGRVLEGATTSFIWWTREVDALDGSGAHGFVVESHRRVPSVTESLILDAAGRHLVGEKPNRTRIGQPQLRRSTPEQLAQHEVWAVNALHGIRAVTSIGGTRLPPPDERRLQWFREALDRTWEPVAPFSEQ